MTISDYARYAVSATKEKAPISGDVAPLLKPAVMILEALSRESVAPRESTSRNVQDVRHAVDNQLSV